MHRLSRSLTALASLSLAAALFAPSEAKACGGGGFYPVTASESVATTGHRVVISISKDQSVLWDQMKFQGDPADFAWVYPAKPGSYVEVASPVFVDVIDGVTTKVIQSPTVECEEPGGGVESGPSCGCMPGAGLKDGAGGFTNRGGDQDTGVQIKHEGTIGPYHTETISGAAPGEIASYLSQNGYTVPADVAPILDAYTAEGYDFITMRLSPDKGVDQMQPVRVVTPGMNMTFPMRMLAAGAGESMALDVLILSEGRVQVEGFSNIEILSKDVTWDFDKDASDYLGVRATKLGGGGGNVFLTSFAASNAIFAPPDEMTADTVAAGYNDALVAAGGAACDPVLFGKLADASAPEGGYEVKDLCDDQGNCTDPAAGQIDSRALECGDAKDIATALIGMHPKDVWITRLEANLPKAALAKDLVIVPAQSGDPVPRVLQASGSIGDACADVLAAPENASPAKKPPIPPSTLGLLGAGLAALAALLRRRPAIRERRTA